LTFVYDARYSCATGDILEKRTQFIKSGSVEHWGPSCRQCTRSCRSKVSSRASEGSDHIPRYEKPFLTGSFYNARVTVYIVASEQTGRPNDDGANDLHEWEKNK
jgi:hypothetical protein